MSKDASHTMLHLKTGTDLGVQTVPFRFMTLRRFFILIVRPSREHSTDVTEIT